MKRARHNQKSSAKLRQSEDGRVSRVAQAILTWVLMAGLAVASERGPVTNLPMPRFVSLKASEANMRRGPSLTHKIDWVLKRRNMPLQVIGEFEHWRRVRDKDGATGWVHYSLISGVRTVIVETDLVGLRVRPEPDAIVRAYIEAGVVAYLEACTLDWCRIKADRYKGWVEKSTIWGVFPEELRD